MDGSFHSPLKHNGNMRVERAQPQNTIGAERLIPSVQITKRADLKKQDGEVHIQKIPGVFTICMEMYGSGAWIGMEY